ncbi:MAG: hypothetical protein H8D42_03705 [Candidatus Marinimicrobia bacterium]|nr:hypothetical protein [Candidatus Neomarinimicrobiota bacterium]
MKKAVFSKSNSDVIKNIRNDFFKRETMISRERIKAIINHQTTGRTGFWLGNPHPDTWPIYRAAGSLPD